MLSEAFFEPALFDDPQDASSSLHWHAVSRYLRECLDGNLLFGSVCDDGLFAEALRRAKATAGQEQYTLLQGLFATLHSQGRLLRRPMERPEKPKCDADWLEEASLSDAKWPFGCFLFRQDHEENRCPLHGNKGRCMCYAAPDCVPAYGGVGVKTAPRGVASLREHLGPLRVSRTVTLVDYCAANPDSAKRFAEGIGACLEEWLSDARVPKREFTISVLWRDDGWRDKLTIWREMARTAIGQRQDVTVQLRLHNDSDCLEKFPRVRFLLTEVAGAEVGKGFDVPEPTKGGDNTFGLLNFEAWISTRQKVNSYFPVEDRANLLE